MRWGNTEPVAGIIILLNIDAQDIQDMQDLVLGVCSALILASATPRRIISPVNTLYSNLSSC